MIYVVPIFLRIFQKAFLIAFIKILLQETQTARLCTILFVQHQEMEVFVPSSLLDHHAFKIYLNMPVMFRYILCSSSCLSQRLQIRYGLPICNVTYCSISLCYLFSVTYSTMLLITSGSSFTMIQYRS